MTRQIKIIFVTIDPYRKRGRILNHIRTAIDMGWNVSVLTGTFDRHEPKPPKGWNVFPVFLRFHRGPLMFLVFNLRLLIHLFKNRHDVIYCRGIWALPAVRLYLSFNKIAFIYDAHEYFAGLEVFKKHKLRRIFWLNMESKALRVASTVLTVSDPILEKYKDQHHRVLHFMLIRNLPQKAQFKTSGQSIPAEKDGTPVILFHGYFMPSRGLENLVLSMKQVNARLVLTGDGVLKSTLGKLVRQNNLKSKVVFVPFIPNEQLVSYARQATIGVSLLQPVSENHKYALPNKFFEYLMAGLAVLVSDNSVLEEYVRRFDVGETANPYDPDEIAARLNYMIADKKRLEKWRANAVKASQELNWEKERELLKEAFIKTVSYD